MTMTPIFLYYPGGRLFPSTFKGRTVKKLLAYLVAEHKNFFTQQASQKSSDFVGAFKCLAFETDGGAADFPITCGADDRDATVWGEQHMPRISRPGLFEEAIRAELASAGVTADTIASYGVASASDLGKLMAKVCNRDGTVANPTKMPLHAVTALWFAREFSKVMARATGDSVACPFTFQTNNNLHNMSAYLSFYAFLAHGDATKASWVINFDGHSDYGAPGQQRIRLQSGATRWVLDPHGGLVENGPWGTFVARCLQNAGYLVFQTGSQDQSGKAALELSSFTEGGEVAKRESLEAFWNNSATSFAAKIDRCVDFLTAHVPDEANIYMTIDRDCLHASCTGWGSGLLPPYDARELVERVLRALKAKRCKLVGFDLTGMPGKDNDSNMAAPTTARFDPDSAEISYSANLGKYDRATHEREIASHTTKEDPWFMLGEDIRHYYALLTSGDAIGLSTSTGDERLKQLLLSLPPMSLAQAYTAELLGHLNSAKNGRPVYLSVADTGDVDLGYFRTDDGQTFEPCEPLFQERLETPTFVPRKVALEKVVVPQKGSGSSRIAPPKSSLVPPPKSEVVRPPVPYGNVDSPKIQATDTIVCRCGKEFVSEAQFSRHAFAEGASTHVRKT